MPYAYSIYFPASVLLHFFPLSTNNSLEKVMGRLSRELQSRWSSKFDHKFQAEG